MNLSPDEAKEALQAIHQVTQKTRQSIAGSGAYIFLIITGAVWMIGYLATQFLSGSVVPIIWVTASLVGSAVSVVLGSRLGKRYRGPTRTEYTRRAVFFWLTLLIFGASAILVAHPTDGRQVTLFIVIFIMIGQQAMGLLVSTSATWWAPLITALALVGYFFFPGIFYLWMGILVGGSMIALGIYIRVRW